MKHSFFHHIIRLYPLSICGVLLLALLYAGSCKKKVDYADYSYKAITAFSIADTSATGAIKGAITQDSIVVYWPGYKAIPDSVAPEITVSEKAAVYPASGQKIAFKSGISYTVTAQDSSKTIYTLYLVVNQQEPTLSTGTQSYVINSAWTIGGFANLVPDTSLTHLYVVKASGEEIMIPLQSVTASRIITATVPQSLADTGNYQVKVISNTYTLKSADFALTIYANPVISSFSPSSGAIGDTVTITGQYFSATSSANTVTFNGTAGSVAQATMTELKVPVPVGASSGVITVTVNGHSASSATQFSVLNAAAATVSTFAGSGSSTSVDGTGTAASFYSLAGITRDPATGDFYLAEYTGNRIRKITADGVVTTFAGSGTGGAINGTGTGASFYYPADVAVDGSGYVYVADFRNNLIRKISPAGEVTTLAGSGTAGYADGTGTAAAFNNPYGIAVDAAGYLYVTDYTGHRIRKISPAGEVTTLAGGGTAGTVNGTGAAAQFNAPKGIAVDAAGFIYVTDYGGNCIRKITPDGEVTILAGSGTAGYADGTGTAAQFNRPGGIEIDTDGYLYVADATNQRIRRVSSEGTVITYAGTGVSGYADGSGSTAMFAGPSGITIDAAGIVYLTEVTNKRIRKITPP